MAQRRQPKLAVKKDALMESSKEVSALGMEQRSLSAAMKDALMELKKEEYVLDMVQSLKYAVMKVAQTKYRKEESVGGTVRKMEHVLHIKNVATTDAPALPTGEESAVDMALRLLIKSAVTKGVQTMSSTEASVLDMGQSAKHAAMTDAPIKSKREESA